MTSKTLTFTAQIEYDPTSTSVKRMAPAMHSLMQDGLEMQLADEHGELGLDFCETQDGEMKDEEKPPALFDERDGWTDYANQIVDRLKIALKPIVDECLEDGVDLRHATFVVQQEVSTLFLNASVLRWLAEAKKAKQQARWRGK